MESNTPPPFVPFFKLAQSNMALLAEFWFSPEVMWQPFVGAQRAFGQNPTGTAGGTSDAWSRLVKGLMENYSRFFVEVTQTGMTPWQRKVVEASTATA
jgi:hypothetical protein